MPSPKKVGLGPGSRLIGRAAALGKMSKKVKKGSVADVYQKPELFKGHPRHKTGVSGPATSKRTPRYIDSTSRSTVESTARGGERGMRKTSTLGGGTRVPRKVVVRRSAKETTQELSAVRDNLKELRALWKSANAKKDAGLMRRLEKSANNLKAREKEILKKLGKK